VLLTSSPQNGLGADASESQKQLLFQVILLEGTVLIPVGGILTAGCEGNNSLLNAARGQAAQVVVPMPREGAPRFPATVYSLHSSDFASVRSAPGVKSFFKRMFLNFERCSHEEFEVFEPF
jgi:hypothetical protein